MEVTMYLGSFKCLYEVITPWATGASSKIVNLFSREPLPTGCACIADYLFTNTAAVYLIFPSTFKVNPVRAHLKG